MLDRQRNGTTIVVFRCMDQNDIDRLKKTVAGLWRVENSMRASAWRALMLDKNKAIEHLTEARRQLNEILQQEEPIGPAAAPPPNTDK